MKKTCNNCNKLLPLNNFGTQKGGKFGLNGRCKECIRLIQKIRYKANPEQFKKNSKNYHDKYPDAKRRINLKHLYGISLEEYNNMLKQQNYCCAICNIHRDNLTRDFDVDHCHKTLKIRGLLCNRCNKVLGIYNDDITLLEASINYLKNYKL